MEDQTAQVQAAEIFANLTSSGAGTVAGWATSSTRNAL